MKYNVVLEGCDCTGKTALARALLNRLPEAKLKHLSAPTDEHAAREQYEYLTQDLNDQTGWVLDRGPLGECVYAPVKRGYYPAYMRNLERSILPHTVLVLVTADPGVVLQRFDNQFLTRAEVPHVLHRFWVEWAASNYVHKMVADTTYQSADELANSIIEACTELFT